MQRDYNLDHEGSFSLENVMRQDKRLFLSIHQSIVGKCIVRRRMRRQYMDDEFKNILFVTSI
jgi:hypothetical protein